MVPASVAKLVAVAAAVDAVGWDYTFTTTAIATGPIVGGQLRGDLVIVGSGDPTMGGRAGDDFDSWVAALKAAGIRSISGRIIGDDNAFDDPRPGAMWAWDDLGYTSGALFGALNYAENRMAVTVTPASRSGAPATLSVEPYAASRALANRTTTGTRGSDALIWPEQRPGEPYLTIAGSLPAGAAPARLLVSAGNPTFWFASVLRNRLIRDGIAVQGEAFDIDDVDVTPDTAKGHIVFTHRSPPLSLLVQPLLKDSINIYAEAVFRLSTGTAGARNNDDALAALRQKLTTWGIDADALQLVDGSGLSRRDAVAAESLVALLRRFYDGSLSSPWMSGLPVAGVDGTLANRLRSTPAHANVRAKSGTMSNIRSLAGYVTAANGEPLAFVIMLNNFEGTGADANRAMDAIVIKLAEFSR